MAAIGRLLSSCPSRATVCASEGFLRIRRDGFGRPWSRHPPRLLSANSGPLKPNQQDPEVDVHTIYQIAKPAAAEYGFPQTGWSPHLFAIRPDHGLRPTIPIARCASRSMNARVLAASKRVGVRIDSGSGSSAQPGKTWLQKPPIHVFARHEVVDHGNPYAEARKMADHGHVVRAQHAVRGHLDHLTALHQAPFPMVSLMQQMDARVSAQIRRVLGRSAAFHVGRRRVEAGAQHRQTTDGQAGVRQPADPESKVEPLGQQIDPARRQVQIDPDVGVALEVSARTGATSRGPISASTDMRSVPCGRSARPRTCWCASRAAATIPSPRDR